MKTRSNFFLTLVILLFVVIAGIIYITEKIIMNTKNKVSANREQVRQIFINGECISKGGIGIIENGYYVITDTVKNVILLPDDIKWESRGHNQIIYIYNGRLYEKDFPDEFKISNSIMINFTKDRIAFFNFRSFEGGYYLRE